MSIKQAAELVRSKGRGEDTVLIHMTPGEVKGLQAIALAHGGSLTVNPETGLPEAGFLKSLLPMIAGAALTGLTGGIINPLTASMIVGGGSTALGVAKGKSFGEALGSGLKAGLGAYGGGSMAGGIRAAMSPVMQTAAASGRMVSPSVAEAMNAQIGSEVGRHSLSPAVGQALRTTATDIAPPSALSRFATGFSGAARKGLPTGGFIEKAAPWAAGLGALSALDYQPKTQFPGMPQQPVYAGPYMPQPREVAFKQQSGVPMSDSSEFLYFPRSSSLSDRLNSLYAARGGEIGMKDGDFVLDARTVSEIGNGSSNAGKEVLARMGGIPIDGRGDGVSDSIRANIGGVQEARVARDEVIIPRERVQAMGGSKQLYNLMNRAHEARRVADRGEDTGLARGLMAV
jgi:hypothetical protein